MEKPVKQSISLNKYISNSGICSRREANKFIKDGLVSLNGETATLGNRVSKDDVVLLKGKPISSNTDLVYIAFNKPIGVTCTTDLKDPDNIIDFIQYPKRIFPIGRLDKPSQGLIFLTNDGDIVNKILRAGNNHEKEYIVTVNKHINDEFILDMANGIPVLDTITKKCKVKKINQNTFNIILTQGLNRQIRRMCSHLGYRVNKLKRVRIMKITLDNIGVGKWRELTSDEMNVLNEMIKGSSKTEEPSNIDD